jgi:nucleotide-binding universal stress UspA family protein
MDSNSKVNIIGTGHLMAGKAPGRVPIKSRGPILGRGQTEDREGPAILVATDGSEASRRAGEYAAWLAGALEAKLFVLYVVDEHLAFQGGIHYGEFVERLSEDGREATGRVRVLVEQAGAKCEELVVLGRPERTILLAAEEVGAEPIVLGAEGMSGLEHTLVGSVSEEVLRHANRTVLVVGGHPEGESAGAKQ